MELARQQRGPPKHHPHVGAADAKRARQWSRSACSRRRGSGMKARAKLRRLKRTSRRSKSRTAVGHSGDGCSGGGQGAERGKAYPLLDCICFAPKLNSHY
eukprot:5901116-Pleurochrysis_carterae.AAC.2